jgi:hypothetical protein
MGLRDRILDYVAKVFMPVPDHPARGGMTGEQAPDDSDGEGDDEDAAGTGDEPGSGDAAGEPGATGDATEAETDGSG